MSKKHKTFKEMSSEEYIEYMDRIKELQITVILIFGVIASCIAIGGGIYVFALWLLGLYKP